jgi:ABC-2 type transport system ATP-binding protein
MKSMNDILVTTDHLFKKFKADFVLKDVNLSFERGKIYAIIGEKGAGKSTFLSLLSGLMKPSNGTIINNADNRAFIFESPAVIDEMTIFDNMKMRCMLTATPFSDINAFLDLVNLAEKVLIRAKTLTKSEKYSLGIALELLGKPEFIAFDEPQNFNAIEIIKKIHSEDQSLLLTGERLSNFADIADEFLILHNGKIIKNITKEYLKTQVRDALSLSVSDPDAAMRILDVKLGIKDTDVEDGYLIIKTVYSESEIVKVLNENAVRVYSIKQFFKDCESFLESLIGGDEL